MHERKLKTSDQINMKCLHILLTTCCLISSGLAKPTLFVPYQDSLWRYSFGYTSPNSARAETRKQNGEVQGAYTYSDDGENLPQASVSSTAASLPDLMEESDEIRAENDLSQACLGALQMRVDLLRKHVQDTQKVIASRVARPQEVAETRDDSIDVTKIGADNVFLRDVRKEKRGSGELEERIPIQAKEENVEKIETKNLKEVGLRSTDKVLETGGTENSEGNLETITAEFLRTFEQDDPAATADDQMEPQKSAATDKDDTPQTKIAPTSILPYDPAYPAYFGYAPLPISIYTIS